MSDFFALLRVGIRLAGRCELDVFPTKLKSKDTDYGLLTLDDRNAFNAVNRSVVTKASARIFSEATPFLFTMYAVTVESFAYVSDWTLPLSL